MRTHVPQSYIPNGRSGVTLIETVMTITLMTFAASALLTSVSSSVQISTNGLNTAIADGLADQLMDEIASVSFPAANGSGSTSGTGRTGFADLDSYNNYSASPPQARSGTAIGFEALSSSGTSMTRPQQFQPNPQLLKHFRQQVTVEKVSDSGTSWVVASQSTTLRRVTVTISYTDLLGNTSPLSTQVRVFSNVAVAP